DKSRISSLLYGRSSFTKVKKKTSAQAVFTLITESTSTVTSTQLLIRGKPEIEDVLILNDNEK
ncbi:4344_t:CDS:1, partial [Diversispora eburnea]